MEEEKEKKTKKANSSSVKKTTTKKAASKKNEITEEEKPKKTTKKTTTSKTSTAKKTSATKKDTTKTKSEEKEKKTTTRKKKETVADTKETKLETTPKEEIKEEPIKEETPKEKIKVDSPKPKAVELPKLNEEAIKKSQEKDLIITRELNINLEEYTYNHNGLVKKVQEMLTEENEENAARELDDPLKGEELFMDIFEDNKNIYRRLRKKLKDSKKENQNKNAEAIQEKKERLALKQQKKAEKINRQLTEKASKEEAKQSKESLQTTVEEPQQDSQFPKRVDKYKDVVKRKQQIIEEEKEKRNQFFEKQEQKRSEDKIMRKNSRKSKKKKSILLIFVLLIILILGIYFISLLLNDKVNIPTINDDKTHNIETDSQAEKEKQLLADYNDCLSKPLGNETNSEELDQQISALTKYISDNYKASVMYENLDYGYTYEYNKEPSYYAASTVKMVDAIYLYTKAAAGEIDLDDTVTYESRHYVAPSKGLEKYQPGANISLRTLIKYDIEVSDNTAHRMIIDYIGKDKLRSYGRSLGSKTYLDGSDNFGNITAPDAMIYVKTLYEFFNTNSDLSNELKEHFFVAEQNDIELPDLGIKAAHKYGEYGSVYHDIGIVYDTHPYAVVILTKEGSSGNFEDKVKDINKHIYELHQAFNSNHEKACHLKVYGS